MTGGTALVAAGMLAGAALQSSIGFGFGLLAAPVLAATAGPASAAPTLAVAAIALNGLVLCAERRPREVLAGTALRLIAWGVPGVVAGVCVLVVLPERLLSVCVALAVLAAVGLQLVGAPPDRAPRRASGAVAGFSSGVLQTSVGLNGPPLVLHLLRGQATPSQMRDTLSCVFLVLAVLGVGIFALSGTLRVAPSPLLLLGASVLGWSIGRRGFAALGRWHRGVSLIVLAVAAVVALVQAV